MKQLAKPADVPNSNLPMHRLNLDMVAFLHHCVQPAEFGQQNMIGNVKMGAGLEHAAGVCSSGLGNWWYRWHAVHMWYRRGSNLRRTH